MFVETSLPRMVGMSEIDLDAKCTSKILVGGKLSSIIDRNAF